MKILFACGGTAGHINPAIAIAGYIKKRHQKADILFVGNPNGMEAILVEKAGYSFMPIEILGFERKISVKHLKHNIKAAKLLATATSKAEKILHEFSPNIVIGTGGYVSGPVLRKASLMGIKTITHESNAFPGVTTKLLAKYVDKILIHTITTKDHLKYSEKCVVTGNPVREDILFMNTKKAREELGIGNRICILSFGGSNGATQINKAIAAVIAWHHKGNLIHHIHATGKYSGDMFYEILQDKNVVISDNPHIDVREYIHDMDRCLAAADLVICRSGAMTLIELQTTGKASILIPSPNVSENHQYYNAMELVEVGAAKLIEEKNLTDEKLIHTISDIISNKMTMLELSSNALRSANFNATQAIYNEIMDLIVQ
ncbi:MAG: undecaprenyldiphospho-muramoylpentapeptide beta-N-acetylglucosaminyltransferase [Oscillospiraceae bacterium]